MHGDKWTSIACFTWWINSEAKYQTLHPVQLVLMPALWLRCSPQFIGVREWEFCILPFLRQNLRYSFVAPTGNNFSCNLLHGPILTHQLFSVKYQTVISWPRNSHFLADIKVHNFLYHLISKNMYFIKLSSTLIVMILLLGERPVTTKSPPNAKEA